MEASTGIEPVYTDLQSAASPLRQLARALKTWAIVDEAGFSGFQDGVQVTSRGGAWSWFAPGWGAAWSLKKLHKNHDIGERPMATCDFPMHLESMSLCLCPTREARRIDMHRLCSAVPDCVPLVAMAGKPAGGALPVEAGCARNRLEQR